MSQSILQNGYAILMCNDSDIDKYLLAKGYLLKKITDIHDKRVAEQTSGIDERQTQIDSIQKALNTQTLSPDTISSYQDMIKQLQLQINRIQTYNTNATFDDIRQTHALFISKTFKPMVSVAYGYSQTRTTPLPLFGSSSRITIPINGDFFTDMVLYFRLSSFKAKSAENKVRYCEFPGHRMIREVRFVMDGTVLDRYNAEDINFFYDFNVSDSQKSGWKRCVGQEVPKTAIFIQDPTHQEVREQKKVFDGYQTLKRTQDEMEIFLPLQFWFCNPKFAMSNYNISFNKTYIEVDLAPITSLVSITDYANDGGIFTPPTIVDFALYTNHIYTLPEVADLFVFRNSFNIVRVHKRMSRILNKTFDMVILDELRFAVETVMINFRPVSNSTNENSPETWNNNNVVAYTQINHPSIVKIAGVNTLAYTPMYYYTEAPAVDTIGFVANGSTIYESNSTTFYDSYLPYRFGKDTVITPSRQGSYLMTFALYPHEDQPSGYMNLSNSKDNYLTYSSSYISMNTTVTMNISARVINFLYLSKGAVSMRFAT
jgi:hypothetical protein